MVHIENAEIDWEVGDQDRPIDHSIIDVMVLNVFGNLLFVIRVGTVLPVYVTPYYIGKHVGPHKEFSSENSG